jgi:hypothetical protein
LEVVAQEELGQQQLRELLILAAEAEAVVIAAAQLQVAQVVLVLPSFAT